MLLFACILLFLAYIKSGLLENPSVIIIGAGPAGIAAATKLLENSISNITILEAENRMGGRVHTVKFGNGLVEVGAEYCHGEKGNIVYELANDLNLLEPGIDPLDKNIYYSNGSQLDSLLINEIVEVINHGYGSGDYNTTGKSVGDLFIHSYSSALLKKYENDKNNFKIVKEGLRFVEGFVLMLEGAFSWFDTTLDSNYLVCEGNQLLTWKRIGYKTIFEILMKGYPGPNKQLPIEDKLRLNSKVERITWNKNQTITVEVADNTSYSANYVIFTSSIGVLKQHKDTLFDPPLPASKQEAIEAIGFAGVIKVFIQFSTKWWKDDDTSFSFFWGDEDIKNIDFLAGPTKNGASWIVQFRDISQLPYNSNVWVGWITGDLVPEIENLPLETVKSGCEYVLNKFLGRTYNVIKIDQILRSTWFSNQNFLGTYSFLKTGRNQTHLSYRAQLADPLNFSEGKPALLFAGEATNPVHYATVHGAIETGHREAERIIKLHRKQK